MFANLKVSCYRALFPCPSPSAVSVASAFCATVTANGVTATNYPTRATAACGSTPDRYISACKCGPTCAPTPTSSCTPTATAGVVNGDFECGIASWTVELPDPAATYTIAPTGYTGSHSFQINFQPPSVSPQLGVSARVLSAPIPVTPGVTYLLSYATWFDNGYAGFTGLMINGQPKKTTDAGDFGWNLWHVNKFAWTPGPGETTAVIRFEFLFGGTPSIDRVDSVSFVPLADCDDGPWPGILPNGDFECGIGSWNVTIPDPAATVAVKDNGGYVSPKVLQVDFTWPPVSPVMGVSATVRSKPLSVTPGVQYKLRFYTWFSVGSSGFIGARINENSGMTVDANDHYPQGGYYANEVHWTAPAGVTTTTVLFDFLFSSNSINRIDAVTLEAI